MMTREEKIDKILDELSDDFIKVDLPLMEKMTLFAKVQNAVNYIETLSSEPCDDAISRKDTCTAIIKRLGIKDETFLLEAERAIYQQILAMPPVQLKPKTGHWVKWYETIEQERCTIHDPHCKCSECNREYDPYIASLFNYCPNCGAKMESEE